MDFKTETTAKPNDSLRERVLNTRSSIIDSLEVWLQTGKRNNYFLQIVKPRIQTLFLEIKPEFEANNKRQNIMLTLASKEIEEILDIYYEIDAWLSEKKIITLANEKRL